LRPHTVSLKAVAGVIRIMATLRSASPPLPAAMAPSASYGEQNPRQSLTNHVLSEDVRF
jgi:hypothetical protein